MRLLASLRNRIFAAMALLALVSTGVAIYHVNRAVTAQAEQELRRGLDEAGTVVDTYQRLLREHFTREAALVADLPRFKAAVALADPPTVQPIADEFRQQLEAAAIVVADPAGRVLARSSDAAVAAALAALPSRPESATAHRLLGYPGGLLQVVTVPIWIDPRQPEMLGTLSVGFSLDEAAAARFRALTNSEVAFALDRAVRVSTLPAAHWPGLAAALTGAAPLSTVRLGDEDYIAAARPLMTAGEDPGGAAVLILRSRTERLRFLAALHRTLVVTAIVAVLAATLVSYAVARTMTRPLGAITAAMRETAVTGDLTRRIAPQESGPWEDEDARVLAATFNRMTDSIARFQREAAQRERLSSLGRLSTVVAHEIRNPLMIIKATMHGLRREQVPPEELRAAVRDIDGEIGRLNRIVTDVLDFSRPIRYDLAPADLDAVCEDAARATLTQSPEVPFRLDLRAGLPLVTTDAERVRLALVNILTNARDAVLARSGAPPADAIAVDSVRHDGHIRISVRDRGIGIPEEDLPRVFDPFFTTRRAGTGLGLAISRHIVEGLGGVIRVTSRPGHGTDGGIL